VSSVTNMSAMFRDADLFNGDVSSWDVSNVMNMSVTFGYTDSFNGDVSLWDVSNVTNMSAMFAQTKLFNGDVSSWDVSNVKNMSSLFGAAKSFNGDISSWDVSNVINMRYMFGSSPFNGDISSWDVSNVIDMGSMFSYNNAFNGDISAWDVSSVTDMRGMFGGANAFSGDISSWDVSNVIDMESMFANNNTFNGDISAWDVSSVTDMSYMFSRNSAFNGDISAWDVSNVANMSNMFYQNSVFNGDVSTWNVSSATDMSYMFSRNSVFNGDISTWDVSSVTDMSHMFSQNSVFNGDISGWDVSSVRRMSHIFSQNSAFNGDLSGWDVSSVWRMREMFYKNSIFNGDIRAWDVSSVFDMEDMFHDASAFNRNPGGWNVSSTYSLHDMLDNSGLSTATYDSTLMGWKSQMIVNKTLGANGMTYCNSVTARDSLINIYGWSISGDITDCTTIPCSGLITFTGSKTISSQADLDNFLDINGCRYNKITGDLTITNSTTNLDQTNLSSLQKIGGGLVFTFNSALTNLSGFSSLDSIGGQLVFNNNSALTSLEGLSGVTTIGGQLAIVNSNVLESLSGLDLIDPTSITNLLIVLNPQLGVCTVSSICEYLSNAANPATVSGNATDCTTRVEIEGLCTPFCASGCFANFRDASGSVPTNGEITIYKSKEQVEDITHDENKIIRLSFENSATQFSGIVLEDDELSLRYDGTGSGSIVIEELELIKGRMNLEGTVATTYTIGSPGIAMNFGNLSGGTDQTTLTIDNSVDAVLNGPTNLLSEDTIRVLASGLLTISDALECKTGSNIDNFGAIVLDGEDMNTSGTYIHTDRVGSTTTIDPGASYTFSPGSSYQLDGTLNIQGTIDFQGDLSGNGTVNGDFTAKAASSTSPGASAGILYFNDSYTLNGTYNAELAGTGGAGVFNGNDQIMVGTTATLGSTSTLNVQLIDGFVPALGDSFKIMTFNTLSGTFNSVNLPGCCGWDVQYNADNITLKVIPSLPIELVDFSATPIDQAIHLKWETASESNNQGFYVEKSENAQSWKTLGFVEGQGNSSQFHSYRLEDGQPFIGNNFYRLKQVDFNGQVAYHNVVFIFWEGETQKVNLYPNPGNDFVTLNCSHPSTQIIEKVRFFDLAGSLKSQWTINNSQAKLSIIDLAAGLYLVEIKMSSGTPTYQYFIKSK
jgi:surface protein